MKTPKAKLSQPKKKSARKHIPALSPEKLELALQELETLKLTPAAKTQLGDMLKAAANPNSERADVVIKTMTPEEQANIAATITSLTGVQDSIVARGKQALMDMSDEEWQSLVDEANSEDT